MDLSIKARLVEVRLAEVRLVEHSLGDVQLALRGSNAAPG
jgi:hypothetical protein